MEYEQPTSWMCSLVEARSIPDRGGRGVFARTLVPQGTLVVVWGGEVVDRGWLRTAGPGYRSVSLQVDEDHYLVSSRPGPADWVNHSCEPNCGLRGQLGLVAMRDIRTGEEICYDYAMSDGSDYDPIDCRCGRPACRGVISGQDWQLPELVERYRGWFSPYIQARIDTHAADERRGRRRSAVAR